MEGFSEVLSKEFAPLGIKVTIVEPGGFRTDWAGSSMTIYTPGPDYAASIAPLLEYRASHRPVGDLAKAAQAILCIAGLDEAPLRLCCSAATRCI